MPQYHLYNPTTDTHYANSTRTAHRSVPHEDVEWREGQAPMGSEYYPMPPQNALQAAMAAHHIVLGLPVESRASHHVVIMGVEAAIQRGDSELAEYLLGTITPHNAEETVALNDIQELFSNLP